MFFASEFLISRRFALLRLRRLLHRSRTAHRNSLDQVEQIFLLVADEVGRLRGDLAQQLGQASLAQIVCQTQFIFQVDLQQLRVPIRLLADERFDIVRRCRVCEEMNVK